jgi:coenzyme F420-reducing hydrogenase alpha subunit
MTKIKRKNFAGGSKPDVMFGVGKEPNIEKYKQEKDTEASYTMKKSDGSAEHKVMEKIGREAKNSLKEKILKGQDINKAEIEMMKEIKEKYGFAAGGLAAKKFLKFVKKGKYTDKTGKKIDIDKEAAKVKPEDLDLETMKTSTPTKMKNGGLVRSGKPKLAKKGWR